MCFYGVWAYVVCIWYVRVYVRSDWVWTCRGQAGSCLGFNLLSPSLLAILLTQGPFSDHGDHPWAVFLFQAPGAQPHCPLSVVEYPPSPAQPGLQDEPQSFFFLLPLLEGTKSEPPGVRFSRLITMRKKMGVWGQVKYPVAKNGGIYNEGVKTGESGPEITQVGTSKRINIPQDSDSNWVPLKLGLHSDTFEGGV